MMTNLAHKKKTGGKQATRNSEIGRKAEKGAVDVAATKHAHGVPGRAYSADYLARLAEDREVGIGKTKDSGSGAKQEKKSDDAEKKPSDPCLLDFTVSDVEGPFLSFPGAGCIISKQFTMSADFSPKCDCSTYEYHQEVQGSYQKTRNGKTEDIPVTMPGGIVPATFTEDEDTKDKKAPHYGHRDEEPEVADGIHPDNRYVDIKSGKEIINQKAGCGYRGSDSPNAFVKDCRPGDIIDLSLTVKGTIRNKNTGDVLATKVWTGMDINKLMPKPKVDDKADPKKKPIEKPAEKKAPPPNTKP
jgi:hypothetical protein